ncbi:MAG: chromosome partitioning ATPase, partial [Actinomycetota bacterium]|nr:chromosome partitioning ATPase [Actinomycetota bacterium]
MTSPTHDGETESGALFAVERTKTDRAVDPALARKHRELPEPEPLQRHGPARVIALCNQKGGVGK